MIIISDIEWKKVRENKDEVLRLLKKYGSQSKLAEALGENRTTIRYWVHKHDIEPDEYLKRKKEKVAPKKEQRPSYEESGSYFIIHYYGEEIKVEKDIVRQFLTLYCQGGMTKTVVETELEISRKELNAMWSAFEVTHDSIPYLEEDLEECGPEVLAEDAIKRDKKLYWKLLRQKKESKAYKELKKYYKEDYKLNKVVDDLKGSLDLIDYEKPKYKIKFNNRMETVLVVCLSDLHIGKKVLGSRLLDDSVDLYDKNIFEERKNKFIYDVIELIEFYKPEKVVVLNSGDSLDNPNSDTYKGQILNQDLRGEEQFIEYINHLSDIILSIYDYIDDIEYYGVAGNHSDGLVNWDVLGNMMLKKMLSDYETIIFNVDKSEYKIIEVYGNNLILTHGNNLRNGKYTQQVDLLNMIQMSDLKYDNTYIISAHEHHYESKEGVRFKHIKLPSIIGGDSLSSDIMNTSSRPSQMVFRMTEMGIESEHFIYFD